MRTLLIIFYCLATNPILANDEDFARSLGARAKNMVWEELKSQYLTQQAEEEGIDNISLQKEKKEARGGLYIFISSSMPKQLLREYYQQSKKYGAVLVFKGLPEGSFQKLYQLVQEIAGSEQEGGAMQIDDEAFARYKIERVPSFVLVKEEAYHPSKEQQLVYDKLTGNVGIKYALEQFTQSGELKELAREYLPKERLYGN